MAKNKGCSDGEKSKKKPPEKRVKVNFELIRLP